MHKRINYIAIVLTILLLTVNTSKGMEPPHDSSNNINCVDCHFAHSGSLVSRGADQENLCKTCHNPTDMPSNPSLYNVTNHLVDGGSTIIDCGSCHEIHSDSYPQTALNVSLIRGNTAKYVTGAVEPAIFENRATDFAFGSDPYNGICETCHLTTSYHRNNSGGDHAHNLGSDCITCHAHEDGFAGSGGGCVDCHNSARDNGNDGITRRAVVGEFGLTSHHVLAGTATNEDCLVCHMEVYGQSYHENDVIDLRDPDSGTALTAFSQFTSAVYTDVQNNLCLKCHDSGGTATSYNPSGSALRPFSSDIGYDVPNVFDQFDPANAYHHAVRGAGDNPYTVPSASNGNNITMESPWNQDSTHDQITCFDCHEANGHGSSNQRLLLDPIDFATMEATTNSSNLPSGMGVTVDTFCIRCHKASVYVNSGDPESVGSIFEYHGAAQNQHGAAGGNDLGCMGCHGGTVDFSSGIPPAGNNSSRGNIHGGNFAWTTGTFSDGITTDYFMLGGWMSGWMTDISKQGDPIGACGGGDCNHTGSDRRSGQSYSR